MTLRWFAVICRKQPYMRTSLMKSSDRLNQRTPGAYTFILPATREVPRGLIDAKCSTIGIRVPTMISVELCWTIWVNQFLARHQYFKRWISVKWSVGNPWRYAAQDWSDLRWRLFWSWIDDSFLFCRACSRVNPGRKGRLYSVRLKLLD